ncbi:MAG: hypothetical protein FJ135_09855 [Deltaproteobacteria bacterium]|nr:hypothetical protein [Deltaproteobacteria bacterium]
MPKNYANRGESWQFNLVLVLGVLAACLWLGCTPQTGPSSEGYAAQVLDGDTIVLADGRRVRYLGIDSPELSSIDLRELKIARQAHKVNVELIQGVKLRLEYGQERYDQYNRLLAYIFLPDGRFLNAELVRQGLAWVFLRSPNLGYQQELVEAQRQAINQRLGWWQELPPADEPHYIGNARSFRFHRPSCPGAQAMSRGNRRIFQTPLEAYWEGFSPARDCKP